MNQSPRGNVLFLILIAVALFAALSYAVTSSTRSSSGNINSDKDSLIASQILQYGATIASAKDRMRLINGCSATDLSFEWQGSPDYDNYAHSPAVADKCKLFNPAGGGVTFRTMRQLVAPDMLEGDDTYTADDALWFAGDIGIHQVGTTAPDLIYSVWYLSKSVCQEINKKLGITSPLTTAEVTSASNIFTGVYPATARAIVGDNDTALAGKSSGCFYTNYGGLMTYAYYQVLIPR